MVVPPPAAATAARRVAMTAVGMSVLRRGMTVAGTGGTSAPRAMTAAG